MSRTAVVLLATVFLTLAPGLALGDEGMENGSQTPAEQSEQAEPCAASSEAASSEEASYCPARSQTASAQISGALDMPIYIPPNRGSPPTRIGGASRGSTGPAHRI